MKRLPQSFLRRVNPKDLLVVKKQRNKLQDRFVALWKRIEGPNLVQEYKFHPDRKFRMDLSHLETKTCIEINGGTWNRNSGHSSGKGLNRDAEKSNLAQELGWFYITLTSDMITLEWAFFCKRVIQDRYFNK